MATDAQLLSYLATLAGQQIPYCVSARFGPDCMDCSGVLHRALTSIGCDDGGASGWTSRTYEDWSTAAHVKMAVDVAKRTPGALLFEGHSDGPAGHIAIVRDASTVYETPCKEGHWFGVSPNDYNRFDAAGAIPGLIYSGGLATVQGGANTPTAGELASSVGCLPLALPLTAGGVAMLAAAIAHIL